MNTLYQVYWNEEAKEPKATDHFRSHQSVTGGSRIMPLFGCYEKLLLLPTTLEFMGYIKYGFIGIFLTVLFSGGTAFASPGHGSEVHAGTRSPETQIGLSGSVIGQDAVGATSSGMTRDEVAALIQDIQAPEETRSLIKLTLLALVIAGLIQLYSPQKQTLVPVTSPAPATPQIPTDDTIGHVS
jgi:hypothetical protein